MKAVLLNTVTTMEHLMFSSKGPNIFINKTPFHSFKVHFPLIGLKKYFSSLSIFFSCLYAAIITFIHQCKEIFCWPHILDVPVLFFLLASLHSLFDFEMHLQRHHLSCRLQETLENDILLLGLHRKGTKHCV